MLTAEIVLKSYILFGYKNNNIYNQFFDCMLLYLYVKDNLQLSLYQITRTNDNHYLLRFISRITFLDNPFSG